MKTGYLIIALGFALCAGCSTARQSQVKAPSEISDKDGIYIQELSSLENYLHDTKQTKALNQLNHILAHNRAMQEDVELARTVAILNALRECKTNEMLQFFEGDLDAVIGGFGSEYRALPTAYQKQINLKPLREAQDYRVKFPLKRPDPIWAVGMTNAFEILNGK